MICGTGIDIVEIARIAQAVAKVHFRDRVFSAAEQAYAEAKALPIETYAGMYAAKEALVKAFGTGIGGADFLEMEVLHDCSGKPYLHLTGRAAELLADLGAVHAHVSISHTKDIAVAQVILEG